MGKSINAQWKRTLPKWIVTKFKISFSRISNRKILANPAVQKLGLAFRTEQKSVLMINVSKSSNDFLLLFVPSSIWTATSHWETGSLYITYILVIIGTERFPVYFPSSDPSPGTADPALTSTFIYLLFIHFKSAWTFLSFIKKGNKPLENCFAFFFLINPNPMYTDILRVCVVCMLWALFLTTPHLSHFKWQ